MDNYCTHFWVTGSDYAFPASGCLRWAATLRSWHSADKALRAIRSGLHIAYRWMTLKIHPQSTPPLPPKNLCFLFSLHPSPLKNLCHLRDPSSDLGTGLWLNLFPPAWGCLRWATTLRSWHSADKALATWKKALLATRFGSRLALRSMVSSRPIPNTHRRLPPKLSVSSPS